MVIIIWNLGIVFGWVSREIVMGFIYEVGVGLEVMMVWKMIFLILRMVVLLIWIYLVMIIIAEMLSIWLF